MSSDPYGQVAHLKDISLQTMIERWMHITMIVSNNVSKITLVTIWILCQHPPPQTHVPAPLYIIVRLPSRPSLANVSLLLCSPARFLSIKCISTGTHCEIQSIWQASINTLVMLHLLPIGVRSHAFKPTRWLRIYYRYPVWNTENLTRLNNTLVILPLLLIGLNSHAFKPTRRLRIYFYPTHSLFESLVLNVTQELNWLHPIVKTKQQLFIVSV